MGVRGWMLSALQTHQCILGLGKQNPTFIKCQVFKLVILSINIYVIEEQLLIFFLQPTLFSANFGRMTKSTRAGLFNREGSDLSI